MDAARGLKQLKNNRGLALVMVAFLMVGFCAFLALAIDIGYLYVTRGQLQTAADSAALAGSSRLEPDAMSPFSQPLARAEAVNFASRNDAATKKVEISSDGSNTLSPGNDIRVGNWNRDLTPNFDPGRTPVNAMQVRARRTGAGDVGGGSIGGPVDLFFGRVLNPIWSQWGTSVAAIAERGPKAGFYLTIGRPVCDGTGTQALAPANKNMAWTSLLNQSTNATDLKQNYLCPADNVPSVEICGESIFTTNGLGNTLFQAAEADFFDRDYDAVNKSYAADGSVSSWTVIVPVTDAVDPTLQPGAQPVWGYASIVITRACGTGNGTPCDPRIFYAPTGRCDNAENDVVISSITCSPCGSSTSLLSARPGLVQ